MGIPAKQVSNNCTGKKLQQELEMQLLAASHKEITTKRLNWPIVQCMKCHTNVGPNFSKNPLVVILDGDESAPL